MLHREFNWQVHKAFNRIAAVCIAVAVSMATGASSHGQEDDPFEQRLRRQAEEQLARLESKRDWYEKNNIPFPTVEDIIEENRQAVIDLWRREIEEHQTRQILNHLNRLIEDAEHFGSFTPEQRDELESLRSRYHRELQELVGSELAGDELDFDRLRRSQRWEQVDSEKQARVREMEKELRGKVLETLLPHQLKAMRNARLGAGLPRLLTESPIGNVLELTDQQRRNIQRNSEELADDIEEFLNETRQRAFDLVAKELTSEQKEKLFELYDRDQILEMYGTARLYSLYGDHKFELPEDLPTWQKFNSPAALILSTKLDDEAWSTEK